MTRCCYKIFELDTYKHLKPTARLATDWTVLGSNPDGGEVFRARPDRPRVHHAPIQCVQGHSRG